MKDSEVEEMPQKTVRFGQIVKEVGPPEEYTLWQEPEKDPAFKRALRDKRVMTIMRPAGNQKDYGLVGYHAEKNASYLVFPGALKDFEGKKIVGVNYGLLAKPKPLGATVKKKEAELTESKSHQQTAKLVQPAKGKPGFFEPKLESRNGAPEKPAKEGKRFTVGMLVTATLEIEREVQAENQREAKRLAVEDVQKAKPDLSQAAVRIAVCRVKNVEV